MKLNEMKINGNNGEIYFTKENGKIIRFGTFNIDITYNHLTIDLGSIAKIEYEYSAETCVCANMYWFKSQSCDRYHGTPNPDHCWATKLFDEVSPFTEEITELLKRLITILCNRTWRMGLASTVKAEVV